jgi:hypothetical protein
MSMVNLQLQPITGQKRKVVAMVAGTKAETMVLKKILTNNGISYQKSPLIWQEIWDSGNVSKCNSCYQIPRSTSSSARNRIKYRGKL